MQGQMGHLHWAQLKEGPTDFSHIKLIIYRIIKLWVNTISLGSFGGL